MNFGEYYDTNLRKLEDEEEAKSDDDDDDDDSDSFQAPFFLVHQLLESNLQILHF